MPEWNFSINRKDSQEVIALDMALKFVRMVTATDYGQIEQLAQIG